LIYKAEVWIEMFKKFVLTLCLAASYNVFCYGAMTPKKSLVQKVFDWYATSCSKSQYVDEIGRDTWLKDIAKKHEAMIYTLIDQQKDLQSVADQYGIVVLPEEKILKQKISKYGLEKVDKECHFSEDLAGKVGTPMMIIRYGQRIFCQYRGAVMRAWYNSYYPNAYEAWEIQPSAVSSPTCSKTEEALHSMIDEILDENSGAKKTLENCIKQGSF
jgi:hypothetical protein